MKTSPDQLLLSSTQAGWFFVTNLLLLVAAACVWAALATFDRTEVVSGVVAATEPVGSVVTPKSGFITAVHVSEGQQVRAGAVLAEIDTEQNSDGHVRPSARQLAALALEADAARDKATQEREHLQADRQRVLHMLEYTERKHGALEKQLQLQTQILTSSRATLARLDSIRHDGYVSTLEYERAHEHEIQQSSELEALRLALSESDLEQDGLRRQLIQIARSQTQVDSDTSASFGRIQQTRTSVEAAATLRQTSPMAGRASALQATTGQWVTAGSELMVIVPSPLHLYASLYAPSRSVGFLQRGQTVRILYDAFPARRFGTFGGRIESVSQVATQPERESRIAEPVYLVRVALDQQAVRVSGRAIALRPGMALTARIVLERRTVLDWILEPLGSFFRR